MSLCKGLKWRWGDGEKKIHKKNKNYYIFLVYSIIILFIFYSKSNTFLIKSSGSVYGIIVNFPHISADKPAKSA